jgi:hypothetical protein
MPRLDLTGRNCRGRNKGSVLRMVVREWTIMGRRASRMDPVVALREE